MIEICVSITLMIMIIVTWLLSLNPSTYKGPLLQISINFIPITDK